MKTFQVKIKNLETLLALFFLLFLGLSCSHPVESNKNELKLEAEEFMDASGELLVKELDSGEKVVVVPDGGWIAFHADVPLAGRYRSTVHLSSEGGRPVSCWIEDYYDNTDDRAYNISGSMESTSTGNQLTSVYRDGSPLNKGKHPIKLHVEGGEAVVDWISFTLLKEHQETPEVLTQRTDGDQWVVVWSDEFEKGSRPDTGKWTYDIGNWGWGNNELQYYTENRPENARIEQGNLIIEARKNDMQEKWTSARLTTRGKTTFVYGRIEISAKVPAERGNWAAGWTLGDNYVDELSWPYCGEIDIMESVGYEMNDTTGDGIAHASVHCGAYYFKLNNHHTGITEVQNMKDEFHLYAIEWTPEYIKAFVDGKEYFSYDDTSDELTWPFDKPQNIILNLAMGGGWGGAQGMDESVSSQQIIIDYVRVLELR